MLETSYTYHVTSVIEPPDTAAAGRTVTLPPPIPASRTEGDWLRGRHLLLWAHTGTAHVEFEDGTEEHLRAGEGVWVPARIGRRLRTDPGSLAFPHPVPPGMAPNAPHCAVRFAVREEHRDWLIAHYSHLVAPIDSFGYSRTDLLSILDRRGDEPAALPSPREQHWPSLPEAPGARLVAKELRQDPALNRTVAEWAALAACSVSTLHRGFLSTGMPFAQWRNLCRMAAAEEFLAAGYGIGKVSALVGFASRNGFARAFRAHHGVAPSDYAARAGVRSREPSDRVVGVGNSGLLTGLLGGAAGSAEGTIDWGDVPASTTDTHVNDDHVLTWMYRGNGWLRTEGSDYHRRTGDAIWIPAGVPHSAGNLHGSIGLPVGDIRPQDAQFTEPIQAHFPPAWNTYLLHRSVSARTRLRPEGFDERETLSLFREHLADAQAGRLPMPANERERSIAEQFLQRMRVPVDAEVDTALFQHETGMQFTTWCHTARMHAARGLLDSGAMPSAVASRVGYGHISNFSRAFSRFYGESPRAFQQRNQPGVRRGR